MSLTSVCRIMIVDDHPIVREGYAQLVSRQARMEICAVAESVSEAMRLVDEVSPDLILIDINLKDGSGLELIKTFRGKCDTVKLMVVSAHDEVLFAERSIRAGATGYINKQNAVESLIEAIETVLSGEIYLSPAMERKLLVRGNLAATDDSIDQSPISCLSDRELEVFQLLGEGASTKQMARKLNRSPKTVDRHRENIKRKLHLTHANDLVRCATSWVLSSR